MFLSFVTLATGEFWRMTGTMIVTRPTERIADDRPAHNKALVLDAMKAVFQRHDPAAVERFYALGHVQHNPYIRQGRDELRAFVAKLSPDVCYEPGITVAEGDFVPFMIAFAVGHPHRWWSLITSVSKMASLQSTGTCCKTKCRTRQRSAAHRCSIPKSALRKSDGRKFD
ncbi:nuclear transport factor 2 family protein [Caballeronia sp. LZ043]|uniref:nuclear transport factor 2 family protein n=1 Tax=Caballeronia sp. LZ043 TaxID=3038569 RepID=UPI0038575115